MGIKHWFNDKGTEYPMSDAVFPLVSVSWLKGRINDPDIVVLDATYHLPSVGRDAFTEFKAERLPGAFFFDVDGIKDPANPLPHMVPDAETFEGAARALGINEDSHVICYDSYGLFSAARPWWMFRLFGHARVSVLDGGMKTWKAAGLTTETDPPKAPACDGEFTAKFRADLLRHAGDVLDIVESRRETILDARGAGRFAGTDPEPRKGLRSGHIPGSLNLPFNLLTNPETGKLRSAQELMVLYEGAGLHIGGEQIVTTCGSGVTACALAFGLALLGDDSVAVYDGSWSEWGAREDTPVETAQGTGASS